MIKAKEKVGDEFQVWNDENRICLGWGKMIATFGTIHEGSSLIELKGGEIIKADDPKFFVIPIEMVRRITERIQRDLMHLMMENIKKDSQ